MNYSIAICDDNPIDSSYVSKLVVNWSLASKHMVSIRTFPSAEAFLFEYAGNQQYDILLLDIEMSGMNGVALAKEVRRGNNAVQIVFITGFPDFIAEGYDVSALHYLIKPVHANKLSSVLDRAAINLAKNAACVIFTVKGEAVRTQIRDIASVEAHAHACTVATAKEEFEVNSSLSDIEKLLDDSFIRCHRSYIIGIRYIKSILKTEITLDNGAKVPLSRSNYNKVNQAFIRYFKGGTNETL